MSPTDPYLTFISPLSDPATVNALAMALVWGALWTLFLHFTRTGTFMRRQRTWLAVVVGIGADLLILALVMPWAWWLRVSAVIAVSSLPIIAASLRNEQHEEQERINAAKAEITNERHSRP